MQRYSWHIGDYIKDTAHLSDVEDLGYRRLLDLYYTIEGPLPLDVKMMCRRARVSQAVAEQILSEFFLKTPEGYRHSRCDAELEAIYTKSESARLSAEKRWQKQKDANAMRTQSEGNATHYPVPITHNPVPSTQDVGYAVVLEKQEPKSKPLQPAAPAAPKKNDCAPVDETALQIVCKETWATYSAAYRERYSTDPVRNAKVSGQVKQFCQRVPAAEAPGIAGFFVRHNASFYVGKGHAVGLLLADAEKLRTEWATQRTMTATQAQQADRTQANGNVWAKIIAEEREKNANLAC